MYVRLLTVLALVIPAGLGAQRLQPADGRPLNEIRATGRVQVVAEVLVRRGRGAPGGQVWLEVRGEIRSGESGPVVVETGVCPVIPVAYAAPARARAVWTGRPERSTADPGAPGPSGSCPEPDVRIRRQVTPSRGHPIRQRFPLERQGTASLPEGTLHFSVVSRVNGERRSWRAGSVSWHPTGPPD